MLGSWEVREEWAVSNLANGLERLKTVGETLQEHSKKVQYSASLARLSSAPRAIMIPDMARCRPSLSSHR
jgi:hypothetical protein